MEQNAKQQIAEQLRNSATVLVTVSQNPSVDQLASAIGLSLMLDALGKHTTAVYSGQTPNTMEFLHPEKMFDDSVDGLRDFIISLSKQKADKLRYKVEDDVVKIFITPYKGKLSQDDLEFSQGDFNVDLVVALGVTKRDDLDRAITAHGRILHDASIVTINNGPETGNLGSVNWSDDAASSLSEMLVSISEALKGGLLNAEMSTAFLTGIVAATERFKNERTTPKVMTMAAQLMAAGANQQLIANNLNLNGNDKDSKPKTDANGGDEENAVELHEAEEEPQSKKEKPADTPSEEDSHPKPLVDDKQDESEKHSDKPDDDDVLADIEKEFGAAKEHKGGASEQEQEDEDPAIKQLETELAQDATTTLKDIEQQVHSIHEEPAEEPQTTPQESGVEEQQDTQQFPETQKKDQQDDVLKRIGAVHNEQRQESTFQPAMGGTFNATSEQAHLDAEQERRRNLNRQMLSHDIHPAGTQGQQEPQQAEENGSDNQVDQARQAVQEAVGSSFNPAGNPIQSLNAQQIPQDGAQLSNNYSPPSPQSGYQQPMPPQGPPQMPQQQYQMPPQQGQQNTFAIPPQQQGYPQQPMQNYPQQQNSNQFYPPQNNGQQQGPPPMPPGGPPPMPPMQ